ncbi:MAG: hypothetical protein E6K81_12485 [Candidatus Eisenbacteria bacterium]|uniref:Exonuclease domain-containing protein n=1 Tax=Eiseniibacteriota bacterium TaxID=2212470 RepID=A0A538U3R1_UNCEI|nr:MAG: hypothetical protein E6K81_12485 [Candidatus Eisenbacteria bacterium]
MMMDRFVAIDVEIASRFPIRICAIGAARLELGQETKSYYSLVAVDGHVRFTHVHGLTAADLVGAPCWPEAWHGVLAVLGDIRTVVAFRASFDRGAILAMSGRHGVRLPRLQFVCAAEMMKARYGCELNLRASLEVLGLPFPGRPHEPLADARAAAAIAVACSRGPPARSRCAIQFSQSRRRRSDRATCHPVRRILFWATPEHALPDRLALASRARSLAHRHHRAAHRPTRSRPPTPAP